MARDSIDRLYVGNEVGIGESVKRKFGPNIRKSVLDAITFIILFVDVLVDCEQPLLQNSQGVSFFIKNCLIGLSPFDLLFLLCN